MTNFGHLTVSQGLVATAMFVVGAAIVGLIVRALLREPQYPRWLVLVVTIGAANFGFVLVRYIVSALDFAYSLREGGWVICWAFAYVAALCSVVIAGRSILPVAPMHDEPVPKVVDVKAKNGAAAEEPR